MSAFDLYPQETAERLSALRPVMQTEPGAFDNFLRGAGMYAMQGFAKTARAVPMAIGGAARAVERLGELEPFGTKDTTLSDAAFEFHDDVFQRAVDYWTPKPHEIGVAGEIAGQLLSTLPLVAISPKAAVAATVLSAGEDVLRKDVDPMKAAAVGAVQGAGLATGIWMPVLGNNLWQRMLIGGAGFNVVQGVGTRAASGLILQGEKAADDFKAFDPKALTLDVILGLAFGGLVHLSPAQRAQGAAAWQRIEGWAKGLKPSEVEAIIALRQAEHLNVDAAPGNLRDLADVEAHAQRARTALEQVVEGKPVQVEDMLAPKFDPDPERQAQALRVADEIRAEADALAKGHDIAVNEPKAGAEAPVLGARGTENLLPEAAGVEPLQAEAMRFAADHPDVELTVGRTAEGEPIRSSVKDYLAQADETVRVAQQDANLFAVAAACMLGAV